MRYLWLVFTLAAFPAYAQFTTTPQAPLNIGTPAITDTGVAVQATGNLNSYYQFIIQNTNAGAASSADIIVNNNLGTATTYYGDFGINSSAFSGTGSLNLANATYVYAASGDLALGTSTSNAIHFVINSGATDALTINTSGGLSAPSLANLNTAATGAVCWTTGGAITYNNSTTCLLSSKRYKNIIGPLKEGLDEVMLWKPTVYTYKNDKDKIGKQVGFIAEDMEKIDKRLVSYNTKGQIQTVRYENAIAVLTKAVQDQQHEIDILQNKHRPCFFNLFVCVK